MSHSSEKRWNDISHQVSGLCIEQVSSLLNAESAYQDLLELYNFVGNTAQALADQLFYETWSTRVSDPEGNPGVVDTQANASEVARASDLIAAMTSLHEIYQAANNVAVAQDDRFTALRRFT